MADENTPAFYPRVGNIRRKDFKPAQPPAFIEDPRAMDLPQYGEVDLSVPSKENLELGRRMTERDAQLRRQREADRSPLEKLAGGLQAGRFLGSAMTQGINAIPTQLFSEGTKAEREAKAEKFIQDRLYKPEQPVAYEYAQDAMDFLDKLETEYKIPPLLPEALPLQYLSGPATAQAARAAGRGAEQAGRAIERRMEPVVRGALEQGGLPREMVLAMGANTQSNVIKPKGGNWLGGSVEKLLDPLITKGVIANKEIPYGPEFDAAIVQRIADLKETANTPNYKGGAGRVAKMLEDDLQDAVSTQNRVKDAAINKWVQSNLTNYVKKDMATPDDPVRKLAEEGISHLPEDRRPPLNMSAVRETRKEAGFPDPYGQSPQALLYESLADKPISFGTAGEMINIGKGEPWMEKVDPFTRVYGIAPPVNFTQDIGFNHIIDVLREDIASGRIRPEQLNKVSMEQAVRRTYEYDQELARKMAEARTTSRAELPVYKDYPEGFKWIQLTRPGDFAAESDAMGHSVRGYEPPKGHPDYVEGSGDSGSSTYGLGGWEAIKSGEAKVYSLVDAKGEPHSTIEVGKGKHPIGFTGDGSNFPYGLTYGDSNNNYLEIPLEKQQEIYELGKKLYFENPNAYAENRILTGAQAPNLMDTFQKAADMLLGEKPGYVRQIKGKGNARPISKYDPYTQDFVKSGGWSDVRDLQNTGLINVDGRYFTEPELTEAAKKYGRMGVMDTTWDVARQRHIDAGISEEDALRNWVEGFKEGRGRLDIPPEGMKRGGKVSISNNPDTMMLEVNNQKMKNGEPAYAGGKGVIKQSLKAAKPPKIEVPIRFPVSRGPTVPEIRAMAERMAPQVMGEFVRAAPTPSKPNPSESVVGKSRKQFEREKTLPIEYENIKEPVTPEEFDYAKKKGALLIGAQGDVTPGNRMLISIDNQPLSAPVHMQAGPEWELYNPSAWAATDQMAKTYMKRAKKAAEEYEADPYLHYHKMTPDANWYAMHHFNSVLGHLRPEELKLRDPKLYQEMLEEIRTKDVGFGKHPEFEGFDDPLNLQIHAQMDPNFRRHIGAIFGGPKFTTRYGLNSGQDVLAATSLPELRDLEAGASGYAVVPLDVNAPLRNFEADSQTYDTGFPKAGASGRSKYPSPYQLIYRDTLNWMKDVPSDKKSSEFGRMNMIVPKQQIDNELIEAIGEYQRRMKELTGKKKGGAVKKAEGGYLKKPAAYINGDEFVNAAKKYGIKDSMNNLNKIVDLVNKGLSVDDAARQVADSGMHKAAGGAIRGDDLILEERPL
jgi:hypothetical protein